jgi:putative transposase
MPRRLAAKTGYRTIEIVERSSSAVGFEIPAQRWIVEHTFAWLSRFRRLARDFERFAKTVAAFILCKRLVASSSS